MRLTLLALLGSLLIFTACSGDDDNATLTEELADTLNGAEVYRFGSQDKSYNEWVVVYRNRTAQKVIYGILVNPEPSVPQRFAANTRARPQLVANHQPQGSLLGAGQASSVREFNLEGGQTRLEVVIDGVTLKVIGDKIQMGGGGGKAGGGFDDFGGGAGGGGGDNFGW